MVFCQSNTKKRNDLTKGERGPISCLLDVVAQRHTRRHPTGRDRGPRCTSGAFFLISTVTYADVG
jgi:hypothetical protein